MEPTLLNAERSEAFARRLLDILNDGALAGMISLGHRTGLFDTLRDMAPSTSEEIADAAGLNERYVREWLGAMLAGGYHRVRRGRSAVLAAAGTCRVTDERSNTR
jgi:hypothetical protein